MIILSKKGLRKGRLRTRRTPTISVRNLEDSSRRVCDNLPRRRVDRVHPRLLLTDEMTYLDIFTIPARKQDQVILKLFSIRDSISLTDANLWGSFPRTKSAVIARSLNSLLLGKFDSYYIRMF